jgi:hypothetical protein
MGHGTGKDRDMNASKGFDRAKFEEAFRIMGQYLLDRHVLGEIAIYGGSAILFQFDWRQMSEDVDARIISGSHHGLITRAAEEAATRLDLPRSWLNETVAMYTRRGEEASDRTFVGVYPSPERVGLRVLAAKPSYILAMKLSALERATADDRDFQDAVNLGMACRVSTTDGLRDVFRKFFPDQDLPAAAEVRLSELARAIQARSSS